MNKRFTMILVIIVVLASQVFAGEYVTYVDPKTGVRYYGDVLPVNAPKDVAVEIKNTEKVSIVGNSSNWNDAARGIMPKNPINVVQPVVQQPRQIYIPQNSYTQDRASHQFSKPTEPSRDRTAREFNRLTNAYENYQADLFEWRSQGRELRQQYNDPMGFERIPTGVSQQEKRYYRSYIR
jgi:hypothetical protein